MTESGRNLTDAGLGADVARVVRTLHRAGPLRLGELGDEPELAGWPPQRIEHAVVSAWSCNLIFVDRRDHFVAI